MRRFWGDLNAILLGVRQRFLLVGRFDPSMLLSRQVRIVALPLR